MLSVLRARGIEGVSISVNISQGLESETVEQAFNSNFLEGLIHMADLQANYRVQLKREFDRRKLSNPRYSQNAFSKSLGLDKTYFSKLMTGKIILSLDLAGAIADRLSLSGAERKEFIISAAEEHQCHALFLLDPSLTDCDGSLTELNQEPKPRKGKGLC